MLESLCRLLVLCVHLILHKKSPVRVYLSCGQGLWANVSTQSSTCLSWVCQSLLSSSEAITYKSFPLYQADSSPQAVIQIITLFVGIYSSIRWFFQFSAPKQEVRRGLLPNKSKQRSRAHDLSLSAPHGIASLVFTLLGLLTWFNVLSEGAWRTTFKITASEWDELLVQWSVSAAQRVLHVPTTCILSQRGVHVQIYSTK